MQDQDQDHVYKTYKKYKYQDYNTVNDAVQQNCLFDVHTWFNQNGLVINPEKCKAVLFSTIQHARASSSPLTDVNVAGCVVPLTDSVKLLGVDRHLTFDSHYRMFVSTRIITNGLLSASARPSEPTWRVLLHLRW